MPLFLSGSFGSFFPLWFEIAQPYNDTVGQKPTKYFPMILFIPHTEDQIPNCVSDVR